MSKKHVTDHYAQEIMKKLNTLIGVTLELNEDFERTKDREGVLFYLDRMMDEFTETIEVIGLIRDFLMEMDGAEHQVPDHSDHMDELADNVRMYEHLAAARREQQDYDLAFRPEPEPPEEESLAMLFCESQDYGIFPFEVVLRICPWLDEHSVIRRIPGSSDLYYLYEDDSEIPVKDGKCLLGPVVVIKLDKDRFVAAPDEIDRFRVKKFIRDNTGKVLDEDGVCHQALRLI